MRSGSHAIVADISAERRQRLREMFEQLGWSVTAWTHIDRSSSLAFDDVNVVVVGFANVDERALATIRDIREAQRPAQILAIVTHPDASTMQQLCEAGVDDVVVEPVDRTLLEVRLALMDYTARRGRSAGEIPDSGRTLGTLLDNLPGVAYRCRNDRDWSMQFVSSGCLELTGYPADDFIDNRTRSWASLVHTDDGERIWQQVQGATHARRPFNLLYRIRTADELLRWVWEQGCGVFENDRLIALEGYIVDVTHWRDAQVRLQTSELEYRGLLDRAAEGILGLDETLNVVACNRRWRTMTGIETEANQSGSRSLLECIAQKDHERIREALRVSNLRDPVVLECQLQTSAGKFVPVELSAARSTVNAWQVIVRDISERRQAQADLARHERFIERIAQASPNILFLYDQEQDFPLYLNRRLETILGFTREQLMSFGPDYLIRLIHPDDVPQIERLSREIHDLDDGAVYEAEVRVLDHEARPQWVRIRMSPFMRNDEGRVTQTVGEVENITERKFAAQAAEQAHRELRMLIESLPDSVLLHREGYVVFANVAATSFFGFSHVESLLGRRVLDFVHPEDRLGVEQTLLHAEPPVTLDEAIRVLRPRGQAWVEVVTGPNVMFEGLPARLVVLRDVTERKKLQAHVIVTDRMASVGTLAAGVAHEINNPLAYVMGNLTYVQEQLRGLRVGVSPAILNPLSDAIQEARDGAERVRAIVSELRTFSRGEDQVREPIDLHKVIDSTLSMASGALGPNVRIQRNDQPIAKIAGNAARIGQVVLNLVVNAAQACGPKPQEIRISTFATEDGRIVIEVSDNGPGIDPELLDRIFDPFFTTKPVGIGMGLGLSICHSIVTSLGGEISVESERGKGTIFRVVLPAAESDTHPVHTRDATSVASTRVLIVDDEATVATTLQRMLMEHQVSIATDAAEAMQLCLAHEFDLILCDIQMPGGGIDFYEMLRRERPRLASAIVFMTGGGFSDRVQQFLDQLPNPRLEKPFDFDRLRALAQSRALHVRPVQTSEKQLGASR